MTQDAFITDVNQLVLFENDDEVDDGTSLLFIKDRIAYKNTGERIKRDEETYDLIIWCLGQDLSLRKTAEFATRSRGSKIKVSKNTIAAIRDREGLAIGTVKKKTSTMLKDFANLAAERLIEEVDSIPLNQLAISMGIAIQRAQDLDGEPNVRVSFVAKKQFSFQEFLDALPVAEPVHDKAAAKTTGLLTDE